MEGRAAGPLVVTMSGGWLWLLGLGAALSGALLGLVAAPALRWLLATFGSAPGPLRVVGVVPTSWAVVVLALLGAAAGGWCAHRAWVESLRLVVDADGVTLEQDGEERFVARPTVAEVYLDGKELVVLDTAGRQLARSKASDLSGSAVQQAFSTFSYPWKGFSDPYEDDYHRWVDGHPDLDPRTDQLLRARSRALAD